MPADRNEAEIGWSDIEDAALRRDWAAALKLTRELEQEWKAVRGFVEVFAGPGADTWGRLMDKAMTGLVVALSARPVDPVAVDQAMSRFRMLMS